MKKIFPLFAVLLLVAIIFSSCIRDNCGGVSCQNEGVCVQGTCACLSGYEGDNCEKWWTDKFDGKWKVTDVNGSLTQTYDLNIVSSLKDTFLIFGLVDSIDTDTVYCIRKSYYAFDILAKTMVDTTKKIESGSGTINKENNTVTGLYSFAFGDSVVATKFTWAR
ncbi:MAG: calcium-binding EGF-like domain-containing protein [Flavipsychrobacter sp.]